MTSTIIEGIDYGPLARLVGTWSGSAGTDLAPEPDGEENNPYYETIEFSACGDVSNAETQTLAILYYRQIVKRKTNHEVFHDQTGYWLWDAANRTVMHTFTIPRAVAVVASGIFNGDPNGDQIHLELSASGDHPDCGISQSPFMRDNAKTTAFSQSLDISEDKLVYSQSTIVDIYGKTFDHTDANTLKKA